MSQCLVGLCSIRSHQRPLQLRLVPAGISLTPVMRTLRILVAGLLLANFASAASKPHVVGFGKPMPVKLFVGPLEDKPIDVTVRALYVDAKLKEFTTGKQHDVLTGSSSFDGLSASTTRYPMIRTNHPSGFGSAADGCWWIAVRERSRNSSCPILTHFIPR